MGKDVVVTCLPQDGAPLRAHQEAMLTDAGRAIARLTQHEFAGAHDPAADYRGHVLFVPGDTLLSDEASRLGIKSAGDLYGGVVPHPFAKTKAITHPLVGPDADRPDGWSPAFSERVRDIVLPGYTAFSAGDARIAASRMLSRAPTVRLKEPLHAGGQGQTLISSREELDRLLEKFTTDDIATYGLVLEGNLRDVTTRSVGQVTLGGITISYHGTQRLTTDNDGQSVYGGSDLVCVRGSWDALETLPLAVPIVVGVAEAKRYDEAMSEYPGFIASRRNYDVGQGVDDEGQRRSGVLESSWRIGGATAAELVAIAVFVEDPAVEIVHASHVEAFGSCLAAPAGAVVHFHGDDPEAGSMLRYTSVNRIQRRAK
jgi:hypothetical protein